MTRVEQLKVHKALLQGRLRLLAMQLQEVDRAIEQVEGSLEEDETVSMRVNGEGVRLPEENGRGRRMVKG